MHEIEGDLDVGVTESPQSGSGLNFGGALQLLREGRLLRRSYWSEAFLYYVKSSTFRVNRPPLLGIFEEGTVIEYDAHIDMFADGFASIWVPTQEDLLAKDWEEVSRTEPQQWLESEDVKPRWVKESV